MLTVCTLIAFALFSGSYAQEVKPTLSGSTVTLHCRPPTSPYEGYFDWRFFRTVLGEKIYSQPPLWLNESGFPATRYRPVEDYGLEMSAVRWQDGGVYGCHFLTGDVREFTTVIVIDRPVTDVSPAVVNIGDEVTLRCSVQFGAPRNNSRLPTTAQFPRLTMTLNDVELTTATQLSTDGEPSKRPYTLTRELKWRAQKQDSRKTLSCRVSTESPAFSADTEQLLLVRAPADDVTVTPHRSQYAVGDVITCSAQGYPVPEVRWSRDADDLTVQHSNLTVTDEMIGDGNSWTCTAQNELNAQPASISIEFSVVSGADEDSSTDDAPSVSMVGVAVIVAAVVVLLIGVIIIIVIVVCRRKRRRAAKSDPDAELTQQNLIYTAKNDESDHVPDYTPLTTDKPRPPRDTDKSRAAPDRDKSHPPRNGDKSRAAGDRDKSRPAGDRDKARPVPKPRAASTSDDLEASFDRSVESDVMKPRPRARGSQESLDKSFDKPQPAYRPRTRGSQQSLDESLDKPVVRGRGRGSADERPTAAMRGSMESLDSVGRPKPRARASLDRSLDDSSELSATQRTNRPPQVASKPARKPATKDRSDETDV